MRILIATGLYPPEVGGPATYSKLLYDELPKRDIAVAVLPFSTVRHLPTVLRHITYFFKVCTRGKNCRVIYAQDTMSVGFPALLASILLRKSFLVRVPGDHVWEQGRQRFGVTESLDTFSQHFFTSHIYLNFLRVLQWCVVHGADIVIVPSNYFKTIVTRWRIPHEKIKVIYNGISPLPVSTDVTLHPQQMISAGRLVPWKGFDFLIETLISLENWKLVIAGDGPDRARLEILVKDLKLEDRVTFVGYIAREQLATLLQESTVFVLNTTFESFSFQTVEAMQMGVPVVVTNIGSLPELIEHGVDGILIEPNNREQLIDAVERVRRDKVFADTLVQHARQKANQFTIERTLDQLVSYLQSL